MVKKKKSNYEYTAFLAVRDWVVTLVKVKADVHIKASTMSVKYYDLIRLKEVIPEKLSMLYNQEPKLSVVRVESKLKVAVIFTKDFVEFTLIL